MKLRGATIERNDVGVGIESVIQLCETSSLSIVSPKSRQQWIGDFLFSCCALARKTTTIGDLCWRRT